MNKKEMLKFAQELFKMGVLATEPYAALVEAISESNRKKVKQDMGIVRIIPEKSLEAQERCIELFGYPKDQYVLRKGSYIHRSVTR